MRACVRERAAGRPSERAIVHTVCAPQRSSAARRAAAQSATAQHTPYPFSHSSAAGPSNQSQISITVGVQTWPSCGRSGNINRNTGSKRKQIRKERQTAQRARASYSVVKSPNSYAGNHLPEQQVYLFTFRQSASRPTCWPVGQSLTSYS